MRKIRIKTRIDSDLAKASQFLRPERNRMLKRTRRRRFIRQGTGAVIFLLVGSAVLSWGAMQGWQWLERTPLLSVNQTVLRGVQRADSDALREILCGHLGRNLLSVDLASLRRNLARDPWVADVTVQRVLPDTLSAQVEERIPAAVAILGGTLNLVDWDGRPIVPWNRRIGSLDLPLITGVDVNRPANSKREDRESARLRARQLIAQVREGLDVLTTLHRHDRELMANLSEVDLSRRDRVIIRCLDQQAPLYLDRNDVTMNLDHYMAVREDIQARAGEAEAIDLRWRGRIVVVPRDGSAREANYGRGRDISPGRET